MGSRVCKPIPEQVKRCLIWRRLIEHENGTIAGCLRIIACMHEFCKP